MATKFRVGYALDPKKTSSFMQPSLLNLAKEQGIELIQVHFTIPLIDQGPFDCILHKSYDPKFTNQFQELRSLYPNIVIMDSPESIHQLHNRKTMLQVIHGLKLSSKVSVSTPKQVFVESHEQLSECLSLKSLDFPVIAKPLLANGSLGSHQMYLIFGEEGLRGMEINPPFVLQEFVNHGGVVFKVYVAGERVMCVKRKSLPDILEEMVTSEMALPFSQISDSDVTSKDQSDESVEKRIEEAELPRDEFLSEVASEMRKALGLNLFNFDMIRDGKDGTERYLVIDINYFPGYAKVPGYETTLVGFFLDVMEKNNRQNGACDGCGCASVV